MFKTTLKTLLAALALSAGATFATAADMSTPSASSLFKPAVSSSDFSGLVHNVNEYQYKKCGRFVIAVYNQCLQSAGSDGRRINRCQREYRRGVQVCHGLR